ncbi:MAG TPA: hypothetical protein VH020_09240 [Stellaceae bacterium]|jgi:hypothetical protein|nr:hypothetical protein [Stellaceae bacterium]
MEAWDTISCRVRALELAHEVEVRRIIAGAEFTELPSPETVVTRAERYYAFLIAAPAAS